MDLRVFEKGTHAPIGIVDVFSDLRIVWRYDDVGEMVINIPVSTALSIKPEMVIWPSEGDEAFVVETVTIEQGDDGDMMTITAYTCSAFLGRRCIPTAEAYEGKGGSIIKNMLDSVFASANRRFPKFSYSINTALGDDLTYETQPMNLLEGIRNVCRGSGLGFRSTFNPVTGNVVFSLYKGVDRSDINGSVMPVTFGAAYDNISNVLYTDSVATYANVAYVMGETNPETEVRTWLAYDPGNKTGYDRYETILESGKTSTTEEKNASGDYIKLTPTQYEALLRDYGREKLAAMTRVETTEGEMNTGSELMRLGIDYDLGDIVMVKNERWDVSVSSRIIELDETYAGGIRTMHIRVGDKMPTLMETMYKKS